MDCKDRFLKRKKNETLMHNIYQYLNNPVETFFVINKKKIHHRRLLMLRRAGMPGIGARTRRKSIPAKLRRIHIYSTRSYKSAPLSQYRL